MANKPSDTLLEFHIRLCSEGAVSPYVHRSLAIGEHVEIDAPLGGSYLRDDHSGPVLAVAGGSGLGPIKSIIDTLLTRAKPPPIQFFFGVRDVRDLYYADHFLSLERQGALMFTPVLSEPSAATSYRTGYLSDVLSTEIKDLAGFKAYLAGPPVMVETCLAAITSHGLSATDCYADSF
jgi:NAD(P)H-flavin reductase